VIKERLAWCRPVNIEEEADSGVAQPGVLRREGGKGGRKKTRIAWRRSSGLPAALVISTTTIRRSRCLLIAMDERDCSVTHLLIEERSCANKAWRMGRNQWS